MTEYSSSTVVALEVGEKTDVMMFETLLLKQFENSMTTEELREGPYFDFSMTILISTVSFCPVSRKQ